jgi:hypothetical protein
VFVCLLSVRGRVAIAQQQQLDILFIEGAVKPRKLGRNQIAETTIEIPVDQQYLLAAEIFECNRLPGKVRKLEPWKFGPHEFVGSRFVCCVIVMDSSVGSLRGRLKFVQAKQDSTLLLYQLVKADP